MARLSKKSNLRIALLTATSLLIAQLGAQAHAYSHIRPDSVSTEQSESHGKLCLDCLSFAPLLATAGGPGHLLIISPQGVAAAPGVEVTSLISRSVTASFRSRAPPSPR